MAKEDTKYTGETVKIALVYPHLSVNTDVTSVFGIEVVKEVVKKKDEDDLVLLVAEVPKQLADEMIKNKRARLYKDVK